MNRPPAHFSNAIRIQDKRKVEISHPFGAVGCVAKRSNHVELQANVAAAAPQATAPNVTLLSP